MSHEARELIWRFGYFTASVIAFLEVLLLRLDRFYALLAISIVAFCLIRMINALMELEKVQNERRAGLLSPQEEEYQRTIRRIAIDRGVNDPRAIDFRGFRNQHPRGG